MRRIAAAIIGRLERNLPKQQGSRTNLHRARGDRRRQAQQEHSSTLPAQQHASAMQPEHDTAAAMEEDDAIRQAAGDRRREGEVMAQRSGGDSSGVILTPPPRRQPPPARLSMASTSEPSTMGSPAFSVSETPSPSTAAATPASGQAQRSLFSGALGLLQRWQLGRYIRTRPAAQVHVRSPVGRPPIIQGRLLPFRSGS